MHVQAPASFPTSVYRHRYLWRKIISHGQAVFCKGAIQDIKSKCQISQQQWKGQNYAYWTTVISPIMKVFDVSRSFSLWAVSNTVI